MDNLNEVKEAMSGKRVSKKKDTSSVIAPTPLVNETPTVVETVDEVVDEVVDNSEQSSFHGCNTCRNFGSYPAWQPCADCCNNPKNQSSFYQA
jgi:hypothetical protein